MQELGAIPNNVMEELRIPAPRFTAEYKQR